MTTRGKFTVVSHKVYSYNPAQVMVTLGAVYDNTIPEDQRYAEATPSGEISMTVKEGIARRFPLGEQFYVDFTPVEEKAP